MGSDPNGSSSILDCTGAQLRRLHETTIIKVKEKPPLPPIQFRVVWSAMPDEEGLIMDALVKSLVSTIEEFASKTKSFSAVLAMIGIIRKATVCASLAGVTRSRIGLDAAEKTVGVVTSKKKRKAPPVEEDEEDTGITDPEYRTKLVAAIMDKPSKKILWCLERIRHHTSIGGDKMLVFCTFKAPLEAVALMLERDSTFRHPVSVFTGDTPAAKQDAIVEHFNACKVSGVGALPPDPRALRRASGSLSSHLNLVPASVQQGPAVMLLSTKAGYQSLCLHKASKLLHLDDWWNLAVRNQSNGRAWRIGQEKACAVEQMRYRGSFDDVVDIYHAFKNRNETNFYSDAHGDDELVSFDAKAAAKFACELARSRNLIEAASRAAAVAKMLAPEQKAREMGMTSADQAFLKELRAERAAARFGNV
jgi:hypothetical protein